MAPPGARPAAPAAARPPAPPAPAAKKDPFGLGTAPAKAPPPSLTLEEDFGDIDVEAPPAAAAPPPALDELSLDVEPETPAAPPPAPIELPEEPEEEPELAPMHAFVPPAGKTGHAPAKAAGDGGEAALREALSQASRDVIERVVWEVVPQLAETIIRENLDRLVKARQG